MSVNATDEEMLFTEISELLGRTTLSEWHKHGRQLDTSELHSQVLDSWEKIYELPLQNQRLILRSSQKILASPHGNRYQFRPASEPSFTVAICGKDFDISQILLSTPGRNRSFAKSSVSSSAFYDIVLDGKYAAKLFVYFEKFYIEALAEEDCLFQDHIEAITDNLTSLLESQALSDRWSLERKEQNYIILSTHIDGISVSIHYRNDNGEGQLLFQRGNKQFQVVNQQQLKPILSKAETIIRMRGLLVLHQTLSDAEFNKHPNQTTDQQS